MTPEEKISRARIGLTGALEKMRNVRKTHEPMDIKTQEIFRHLQYATCQYLDAVEEARATQTHEA